MVKTPHVGVGKTRLARDIGRVEAWRVNRLLQARTLRLTADPRWRQVLVVSPDRDVGVRAPGLWPAAVERRAQGGGDLGARLIRIADAYEGPLCIIGADCPGVRRHHIAAAFLALRRAPVAVGPAPDGGFWAIAARRGRDLAPGFESVRWSSSHTLADVRGRLRVPSIMIDTLSDVDDGADWTAQRWLARSSGR